jgi:hypothetical protein
MSVARRRAALGAVLVALAAGTENLDAQRVALSVQVVRDSIAAAPNLSVTATGVQPELEPVSVRLEASRDASFQAPFYVRMARTGDTTFTVDRLLPEKTLIYFRTTLLDRNDRVITFTINQYPVRSWVRLVSPGTVPNDVQFTRRPPFVWSPSSLTLPPGPWVFDLTVLIRDTNQPVAFAPGINDTVFVFDQPLEANTSFLWRLRARALNSTATDDIIVTSQQFSIASAEQPRATVFYQNFPNPFGRTVPVTCFWFDLARRSRVRLTIYDIRLREVKNVISGIDFPAGAYGRLHGPGPGGCDDRFLWDATDDRGHRVPPGVYIAVFEGDGKRETKKIVYQP